MEFQIQVVQIDRASKPTKTGGTYQQLEVAYKNLSSGKLESKKLMSFVQPDKAYKLLNESKQGDVFTIDSQKEGDYWQWKDAKQSAPGSIVPVHPNTPMNIGTPSPKSNYETPDERAKKQVYIIKQSSLSAAIALLTTGAKVPPSTDLIIQEAQRFTDWVLQGESKTPSAVALASMPDDMPD